MKSEGRSATRPTHYRVGRKGSEDVYWHPVTKYAIERQWEYLEALSDTEGVSFFPDMADLIALWNAVDESQGRLREAMDSELLRLVDEYSDAREKVDNEVRFSDIAKDIGREHVATTEAW